MEDHSVEDCPNKPIMDTISDQVRELLSTYGDTIATFMLVHKEGCLCVLTTESEEQTRQFLRDAAEQF